MASALKQRLTPCLWFDSQAEDAAKFYTSVFPNSTMGSITHYGEGAPMPAGTVLTVKFHIEGVEFMGLNGGSYYTITPGVSFVINCDTQEEIDHYWSRLGEGGRGLARGRGRLRRAILGVAHARRVPVMRIQSSWRTARRSSNHWA